MDDRLNRLENKLDQIVDSQAHIRADLQEHMRRTVIAESNIDRIVDSIKPIQSHVAFIRGLGKILSILGTLIGGLAAAWQIIFRR